MSKHAQTRFPVLSAVAERWSPRAFSEIAVTAEELGSVLEAGRWAASAFNEQPWRFLVGRRGDATHGRIRECLVPANQVWAGTASVLLLSVARSSFTRNGKANRHAWHDTGLASAGMVLQATALGLHAHMMAGFDADAAREAFAIPEEFEPVAAMALGRLGSPAVLEDEGLRQAELAPRTRRPLAEIAFQETWERPLEL